MRYEVTIRNEVTIMKNKFAVKRNKVILRDRMSRCEKNLQLGFLLFFVSININKVISEL